MSAYDYQKSLAHFQEQVMEEVNDIWSNPMRYHAVNWYWMPGGLRMHRKSMTWMEMERRVSRSGLQARSVIEPSVLAKKVQMR